MLFPIIKVKDNDYKNVHIVGSDEHDSLYIDEETGGIQYLNLQCVCGTKKFENKSVFEFIGTQNKYDKDLQIEFITFEELKKIYEKQKKKYLCMENFKSEKCSNDRHVSNKYLTVRAGGIWNLADSKSNVVTLVKGKKWLSISKEYLNKYFKEIQ